MKTSRITQLAFLAGIVCNIIPGVVPVVALKDIAELDYAFAETLALVIGFYVIMFMFIEIPLIGYMVRTAASLVSACRTHHSRWP